MNFVVTRTVVAKWYRFGNRKWIIIARGDYTEFGHEVSTLLRCHQVPDSLLAIKQDKVSSIVCEDARIFVVSWNCSCCGGREGSPGAVRKIGQIHSSFLPSKDA